jgi:hypothetical protein
MKKNDKLTNKEVMRQVNDELIKWADKVIDFTKPTTRVDTHNLVDSQIAVPSRPTATKVSIVFSEAYYAQYFGHGEEIRKQYGPNSLLEKNIFKKRGELYEAIEETVLVGIQTQLSKDLKAIFKNGKK